MPFNCNTESLQGSSFSLEEELSDPDHPLEPLLQKLRPGHLCARQQRQQQMWDEEGPTPVSAATVREERDEECQGDELVKFLSSIGIVLFIKKYTVPIKSLFPLKGAKGKDLPA